MVSPPYLLGESMNFLLTKIYIAIDNPTLMKIKRATNHSLKGKSYPKKSQTSLVVSIEKTVTKKVTRVEYKNFILENLFLKLTLNDYF